MQPVLSTAGIRAVVLTTAEFFTPPFGGTATIQVDNATALIPGQPINLRGFGFYRVVSKANYRTITIEPTEGCQTPEPVAVPIGTKIVPGTLNTNPTPSCLQWATGVPGAQPTINALILAPATVTTAPVTQPAIGVTAVFPLADVTGITVGTRLVILEGNVYEVTLVVGLNVTMRLLEITTSGGIQPGQPVPTDSDVCFATNARTWITPNGGTPPDLSKYRVKTIDTRFADPDNAKKDQNVTVCLGPGIITDPNSGIYTDQWVVWSDYADQNCKAALIADIPGTTVNLADIYPEYAANYARFNAFSSFCFDQDANVCMAWEVGGNQSAVLTKFGGVVTFEGFSPILVSNKDPRYYLDSTAGTDVIVYYLKGDANVPRCSRVDNRIYFRVQRDLFAIEYTMASDLPYMRGLDFVQFNKEANALCGGYEFLRVKDENCNSITLRSTKYQPVFGFEDAFANVSPTVIGGSYALVAILEVVPTDTHPTVSGVAISGDVFDSVVLTVVPTDTHPTVSGVAISGDVFDVIVLAVQADTFATVSPTVTNGAYFRVLVEEAAADSFATVTPTILGGSYAP